MAGPKSTMERKDQFWQLQATSGSVNGGKKTEGLQGWAVREEDHFWTGCVLEADIRLKSQTRDNLTTWDRKSK